MARRKTTLGSLIAILIVAVIAFTADRLGFGPSGTEHKSVSINEQYNELTAKSFPDYDGDAYIVINDNEPYFEDSEITDEPFEMYSDLDRLGRCGAAFANICIELMPTKDRESISSVHPSGWHSVKYDFIEGGSLYNRSHLIGFQLAGENANKKNLITGTRYLNAETMLPFEDEIAEYVKETDNHVMYRVTPYFEGDNLVAKGVLMEAYSVEDWGKGVKFNVFCYNVQPGVYIDYATGDSRADGTLASAIKYIAILKSPVPERYGTFIL